MTDDSYHPPTSQEQAFLRIVTLGYPELQAQVESCEIADYDPLGYCAIRVLAGPPSPIKDKCDGPLLLPDSVSAHVVDLILWITKEGMLDNIEVIEYGGYKGNIYQRFIDAASHLNLSYRSCS